MRHAQAWTRFHHWPAWILGLSIALVAASATAMPMKWRSSNFKYIVDGKPVRDVLRDFGASQGMVVAVAADVEGAVVGKFDVTPRQFLDLLALSYGFVYYYNGAVLHVSAAQGMRSTLIRLNHARVTQLRETLERMGVAEARFPLVYDEAANTALVAGPQEYVDVIREIAVQLENRTENGGRTVTRVFPLRFAWAADRRNGDDDAIPGMASLLQALYSQQGRADDKNTAGDIGPLKSERALSDRVAPSLGAAHSEKSVDSGSMSLRRSLSLDMKHAGAGADNGAGARGESTSFAPTAAQPGAAGRTGGDDDASLPVILPNVAENSILVRDLPERMPAYAALIASLDIQPRMVEIAVQILDI